MKWKRTDLDVKAKVIVSLMEGKQGSDIAKDLWLHESTVSRIKDNDLQEVARSSDIIARICENDLESVENMSVITKRFTNQIKMQAELDRADIGVANQTTESAFKRRQLLMWDATERSVITIDNLSDMTTDQIAEEVMKGIK